MQLVVDTHTHTVASGHAYSTILENGKAAKDNNIKIICNTDHGPQMPGAAHYWNLVNQGVLPRVIDQVGVLRGVEANILCSDELLDVPINILMNLDWVNASFHEPTFVPQNYKQHTKYLLKIIESKQVDALAHLGNPNFDFDFDIVLEAAAAAKVAIEINNSTLLGISRKGSVPRCYEIIKLAVKYGNYITTGSDAHFCQQIGKFSEIRRLLQKIEFDQSKIITSSTDNFLDFLKIRGKLDLVKDLQCKL